MRPLSSMLPWLGRNRGPSGWTAVDAGTDGLRAVSVRLPRAPGDRPRVVGHGHVPGDWSSADVVSLAAQVGASRYSWTLVAARKDYRVSVVDRPGVEVSELNESARWVIGPTLDYPAEEAVVACMRIPVQEPSINGPEQLYVVSAKKDVIEAQVRRFLDAKLPVKAVDIRETAQRNVAVRLQRGGEGIAMVSASDDGVQLTFTLDGELYLDRYVNEPVRLIRQADRDTAAGVAERIVYQVQRSLEVAAQTLPFLRIERVVVGPAPAELVDALASGLAASVEPLDLGAVFDLSDVPDLASDPELLEPMFPALGAALREPEAAR
jgi:hypothetical protein